MSATGVAFLTVEVVATCVAMGRWSYINASGVYVVGKRAAFDEDLSAFFAHLFLGVLWPIGIAVWVGHALQRRAVTRAATRNRLEQEERALDALLEARS